MQNDPDNFLLYPYFMKKCSKLHTLGWGWPCSSPGCSSEGQWWPTKFFAFFTLVNLPDHGESGPVHGQISGFLISIWLHSERGISCLKTSLKMSGLAFFAHFWWFFQCKLQQIVWTATDRKYVSDHIKIQLSC